VSPNPGGKGTSGKGGGGKASGPAATRRLGLIVFGAAFVVLFVVVAIAEGIGSPSVPSGDIALVEGVPGELGEVTEARFEHALELASKQGGEKKVPKPGDAKYEELKETALSSIFESIWLQGLAAEEGIEVSEQEVAKELKKLKKESFKTEAEFKKFLKESGYNSKDVNERVKLQILSAKLQENLKEKAPQPSKGEIEAYYEAAKATQFTQKPSRTIRVVVNKSKKKAEEALQALEKDDSAKSWKDVAKKYSEDPTTKENGGLREGVQEGVEEEPLNADIFGAPEGRVEGPIKTKSGYTVFEVKNSTPESVQELKTVENQIQATLAQRAEQEYFTTFVGTFSTTWTQRTHCASGYVTERCANYKSSGHSKTAPETCYEANPKGGLPEACPAPVNQLVPAMPGTVTPLEPKGKPLAQRPRPAGEEKEEGAAGLEGLPEGVAPPSEAPPAEEAPPSEGEGKGKGE
jgi:parvulin-like peptidyl-prolyl isomerase